MGRVPNPSGVGPATRSRLALAVLASIAGCELPVVIFNQSLWLAALWGTACPCARVGPDDLAASTPSWNAFQRLDAGCGQPSIFVIPTLTLDPLPEPEPVVILI